MQGKHFRAFSKIYLISLVLFANYSIGLITEIYQIFSISYDSAGDRNKGMFLATLIQFHSLCLQNYLIGLIMETYQIFNISHDSACETNNFMFLATEIQFHSPCLQNYLVGISNIYHLAPMYNTSCDD